MVEMQEREAPKPPGQSSRKRDGQTTGLDRSSHTASARTETVFLISSISALSLATSRGAPPSRSLSRERHPALRLRARRRGVHGEWPRQGRRFCGRRERDGSQCQAAIAAKRLMSSTGPTRSAREAGGGRVFGSTGGRSWIARRDRTRRRRRLRWRTRASHVINRLEHIIVPTLHLPGDPHTLLD